MRIVFLGPPGVGKGTQAKFLCGRFSMPHVATGDLLRQNLQEGTALGKEAQGYMQRGVLVPDDLVTRILEARLSREDCRDGFLLDGYPRNRAQAEELDRLLKKSNRPIGRLFYLTAPEEVIVRRIGGRRTCRGCAANFHVESIPPKREGTCDHCGGELFQREDDRPDTIRRRLKVYQEQIGELLAFYRGRVDCREVDGARSVSEVSADLVSKAV
jgi:adenylate kinase